MENILNKYKNCNLCPRKCNIDRLSGKRLGFCKENSKINIARAALHMWEEPCISGEEGSGTVFFSGCNMGCVFCQNHDISDGSWGKEITVDRLTDIFFELEDKGANNINLVTADHFVPSVVMAIEKAKNKNLSLPFLFNTSSYIEVGTLKMLDGFIDIYLPDFKYWTEKRAGKYSRAGDYPVVARNAICEMVRQIKEKNKFEDNKSVCSFSDRGIMQRGIIVRHLLMPGGLLEAKFIIKYLYETYGDDIYISILNQYTPISGMLNAFPEINKRVTEREYDELINYAVDVGVTNGFMQEGLAASESFIPAFDYEGVDE